MGHKPRKPNADGTWDCNTCLKSLPTEAFYADGKTGKPKGRCKGCHIAATIIARRNSRCDDDSAPFVPTPEQIAEGTARIRRNWSEKMHYIRAGFSVENRPDGTFTASEVDVSIHGHSDGVHRKPQGSQIPKD